MPKSKVKSKKEQPNNNNSKWIIGIFAVVAIIAIAFIVMKTQPTSLEVSDDSAFAGQAVKAKQQIILPKCPTCPAELKYYEITAAIDTPQAPNEFQMSFSINGEQDTLSLPTGYVFISPTTGIRVLLQEGLFQGYAGGIRKFSFNLDKACAKRYQIRATDLANSYVTPVTLQTQWQFWMDGEQFNLAIGESHTLADGTKLIFRNILQQDFVGGMYGINFDILCKSRLN